MGLNTVFILNFKIYFAVSVICCIFEYQNKQYMKDQKGKRVKTVNIKLLNWPAGMYYVADKYQYTNHRGVLKTRYKVIERVYTDSYTGDGYSTSSMAGMIYYPADVLELDECEHISAFEYEGTPVYCQQCNNVL